MDVWPHLRLFPPRLGLLAATLVPVLACGCHRGLSAEARPENSSSSLIDSPRTPSSNASTIQRSPAYKQAVSLYSKRDFQGALVAIDTLSSSPALTKTDLQFLRRQRNICLEALGERRKGEDASSETMVAAKRPTPPLGDCGPRALAIVARHLGKPHNLQALTKTAASTRHGTSLEGLKRAAKSIGMEAEGVQVDGKALRNVDTPALSWVDGDHYIVVLQVTGDESTVHDPNKPKEEVIETEELLRRSGGILLMLRPM